MAVAAHRNLVGREDELVRVLEFVSQVSEGPRAMVIRGEAGIGKTTLWRAAIDSEEAQQLTVLSARCVEAELPLGLAGLSDLLQAVLPAITDEVADHERSALAVAIGLEAPKERQRDAIALPRAFLALLRALALDRPVLVAIDDIQWLDAPSARVVAFACRRLGDSRVAMLLTHRDGTGDPLDAASVLGESLEEVRLGPLSLGALAHLARTRLGMRIPRPLLARVHDASGGNPMFALEFARAIGEGDGSQLGPVPMPASLQELVRARLEQQPPDVRRLLAIVGACEQPTLSVLATVDPAAAASLDAAMDAGVLTIGTDRTVGFTHPLLASAAYADLPLSQRRAVHAQLAQALDDAGERARHLALATSEPDANVAALLDDAAARAHGRGGPEAAADLAQEAVRLTPADAADLYDRMLSVAEYFAAAGLTVEASEWVDKLLAPEVTGTPRARVLNFRAWLATDMEAGGRILVEAFEYAGDDATLRAHLLLALSGYHMFRDELDASERAAREALATAEHAGDPVLLAASLAIVADRADLAGRRDDTLAERAIELEDVHGTLPGHAAARERLARIRLRRADLTGARGLSEGALGEAIRAGAGAYRYVSLTHLFDVEWRAGNWQLAERYLEEALGVVVEGAGGTWAEAELPERRARLKALRGDVDEARRLVAEGMDGAESIHWAQLALKNRWVLGFLEVSLGEPARAWQALADIARASPRGSLEVLEAVADGVEALVALDRLDSADELLERLRYEAGRGHRWAAPAAERCAALLLVARGDPDAAVVAAERAAAGFETAGFPLDRARALFVAGEALRRSGKRTRAAERIEAAKEIFERLGAALWVKRAETELRRANPRPRRDHELTSAERRVARLVASGLKNREVASQLFTTEATVEKHLTSVYRKLGVRSRTELARRVADGSLSLDDE